MLIRESPDGERREGMGGCKAMRQKGGKAGGAK